MLYKSKHPLYDTWNSMRKRCKNPRSPNFKYYGGRGIKVCERWESFENWMDDMGPRPDPKYRLVRLDLAGDYEPSNCKWGARGEEGTVNRRGREFALKSGDKVSRPLGSLHEAELKRKQLLEELASKGVSRDLDVVWRPEGEEDWRLFT